MGESQNTKEKKIVKKKYCFFISIDLYTFDFLKTYISTIYSRIKQKFIFCTKESLKRYIGTNISSKKDQLHPRPVKWLKARVSHY